MNQKIKFRHGTLSDCHTATNFVVVIDVLRAFTTAAYAFQSGAKDMFCVSEVEEAFHLHTQMKNSYLLGEINGYRIPGFHYNNSPAAISSVDLTGKTIIMRTTAGTQGLIRSIHAETILACSFVNASATAAYIQTHQPDEVFFVETGVTADGRGDEDIACAEYVEGIITNQRIPEETLKERVINSKNGMRFQNPSSKDLPKEDLDFVCSFDLFHFAMTAERINSRLIRLHAIDIDDGSQCTI